MTHEGLQFPGIGGKVGAVTDRLTIMRLDGCDPGDPFRRLIERDRGHVIASEADSLIATFDSAADAIAASCSCQVVARDRSVAVVGSPVSQIRIGVSAGDVAWEGRACVGRPVGEAEGLCAVAEPGEILVSDAVRALVGRQCRQPLEPAGTRRLDGVPDPVACFTVAWGPDPPSASFDRHEGEVLWRDRFEPLERVGGGAEGEVWRGRDITHDRLVALKVRDRPVSDEARTLLGVEPHRGLPLVRDDFTLDDGRHVLVMDWVDGVDLGAMVADRGDPGLPVSLVLEWLGQVAAALDHLHGHHPPVVHGDVKPANIVLDGDRVVLVDFGIAGDRWSIAGPAVGTPGFAPPDAERSPASDVYALAATAVALLTGRPPTGGVPSWEGIDPNQAAALERALRRGLALEPARRPPSASALVERLRAGVAANLPGGVVTFVSLDVPDSGELWGDDPDQMTDDVRALERSIEAAVDEHGGSVVATSGDNESALLVFRSVGEAVAAAEQLAHRGPLEVRVGVRTVEAEPHAGRYDRAVASAVARTRDLARPGSVAYADTTLALTRAASTATATGVSPMPPVGPSWATSTLPLPRSTFIGREAEIAHLRSLMARSRLVTLTGVGGVGKTRLAIEVAAAESRGIPDGVYFVDLSSVRDAGAVGEAFASGCRVPADASGEALDMVRSYLASRSVLVVVDNCEQVLDAAAGAVDGLLAVCPGVKVLATSRELLEVDGERPFRVDPLLSEGSGEPEAVLLFVDRARSVDSSFDPTGSEEVIARICRQVDGVPLAIELAAARTRVLSVHQILERLDHRLSLLRDDRRRRPRRQQTLRAAIEWSFDLLDPPERALFAACGAFAGGWTLEAAAAVCDIDEATALDLLAALVAKSLVRAEPGELGVRYSMLETLREFACEQLDVVGAAADVRARHARFFAGDGGWAQPAYDALPVMDRLRLDRHNLRAAAEWALERGDAELAAGVLVGSAGILTFDPYGKEVAPLVTECLGCEGLSDAARGRLHLVEAMLDVMHFRGMQAELDGHLDRALPLLRRVDDPMLPYALGLRMLRDPVEVAQYEEEAQAVARRQGSSPYASSLLGVARSWSLGRRREYEAALAACTEAEDEEVPTTTLVFRTLAAATLACLLGRPDEASAMLDRVDALGDHGTYPSVFTPLARVIVEVAAGEVEAATRRLVGLCDDYLDAGLPLFGATVRMVLSYRAEALGDLDAARRLLEPPGAGWFPDLDPGVAAELGRVFLARSPTDIAFLGELQARLYGWSDGEIGAASALWAMQAIAAMHLEEGPSLAVRSFTVHADVARAEIAALRAPPSLPAR